MQAKHSDIVDSKLFHRISNLARVTVDLTLLGHVAHGLKLAPSSEPSHQRWMKWRKRLAGLPLEGVVVGQSGGSRCRALQRQI